MLQKALAEVAAAVQWVFLRSTVFAFVQTHTHTLVHIYFSLVTCTAYHQPDVSTPSSNYLSESNKSCVTYERVSLIANYNTNYVKEVCLVFLHFFIVQRI